MKNPIQPKKEMEIDVIKILPDSVANQIAAGEVIQRPSYVIKELVENAVDAEATEIQIVVKDAGKTLIQVVDNGKGMSSTDARLAFDRHATSKIRSADDLYALHTMGFRGEALPSICAVSQVELRTMQEGAAMGTRILINGSKVELQEPCVCTKGSNFMVRNLFYNTPARRRFLKSDNAESVAIMREFERMALVNPGVRFTFSSGNKRIDLRGGSFKQRIADIWKGSLNMQQLVPIDVDTSMVKISGFVALPEFARRHNPLQFMIVNGRHMKHPYFHKSITRCYENLIAPDTQPCYFLRFDVPPESIDVNVHPTKNEIKFENEQAIVPILTAAVRAALGRYSAMPSIDFTEDIMPLNPPRAGEFVAQPKIDIDPTYNPFANPYARRGGGVKDSGVPKNWDKLYAGFMSGGSPSAEPPVPDSVDDAGVFDSAAAEEMNILPFCLQLAGKYILSPSGEGLLIIDQYRAHVKILFEEFMERSRGIGRVSHVSQQEMFPETLALSHTQNTIMESIAGELRRIGFVMKDEGGNNWRMEGVPATLSKRNPVGVLLKILDYAAEEVGAEKIAADVSSLGIHKIALAAARVSAVQGGTILSASEMEQMVSKLFSLPDPQYTPDGHPIVRKLSLDRIKQMFD